MINCDLRGKKLLLIGGVAPTLDLVNLARRNGVFIGVADYNKDTVVKRAADVAYDIDVTDVDAVVDLYKREKFDGLISNFVDMLSPYVTEVANRVGAHVPYTVEQLKMSTDKKYFKNKCIEYDVPVPKEYNIRSLDDIDKIDVKYPVIIKPVDGSGSKGITVCNDIVELKSGYEKALAASRNKSVIIEEFIPYDEINVTYIIQDGDIQLAAIHDRYLHNGPSGTVKIPDIYIYPSRYTDIYLQKYNEKVINMLKGLGLQNGSMFMQACVKDNQVYFYEAGMRLNGCKTYQILEVENNYNTFEHLMQFALTGSMGEHITFNPKFKHWYATWNVAGRPGAIIDKSAGLDEMLSYPWLIQAAIRYFKGDQIPPNSEGTLMQLVGRIHVCGDTKEQLLQRLEKIFSLYQLYDSTGEKILLDTHDIEDLRKSINYSL